MDGLDDLWTGLYPTISTGGRCIALSTPNGVGGWFYKTYVDSEARRNDFHPTKLMWDTHPDRDQLWFEKETKNMSIRQIAQELECNFNTSGETVIHPEDLKFIESNIREPKYRTGFDRNFWIWEEYVPENTYVLSADVARGDGQDYSVFHVFKLETLEVVAEYQGKVTPDVFSNIIFDAGKEYGDCLLVVENNSVGFAVLEKLKDMNYPNVYYSIKSTHEYIDQLTAEHVSNSVAGFTTSSKTRPIIVAKMEEFIRNKLIITYSSRLYNEFKTFVWNNGKAQAMRTGNDDLVMSFAIGCWIKDTVFVENKRKAEYQKACLNSMIKSDNIINTSIPGMKEYKPVAQSKKMQKSIEERKEFIWLLKG